MKFCLIIFFSGVGLIYSFYEAPENKPRMYFDGTEWRSLRPERNATLSRSQKLTLSMLLSMLDTNPSKPTTISDKFIDLDYIVIPQTLDKVEPKLTITTKKHIEKIFDQQTDKIKETTTVATTTTEKADVVSTPVKNVSNLADYNIIITQLVNKTKIHTNKTIEAANNISLISNPTEWLKLGLELSKTLNELIKTQKSQNNTTQTTTVVTHTTAVTKKPTRNTIKVKKPSIKRSRTRGNITKIAKNKKSRRSRKQRRAMDGIDDLIAIFTDGIEIDNGSEISDDLHEENRKYLKELMSRKFRNKQKVDEMNMYPEGIKDIDSADIISDGESETRFVLVEANTDVEDSKLNTTMNKT